MKTKMYSIYDAKAQVYNKPFHMVNHDTAIRSSKQLVNDPATEISKYPEDFSLWYLGEFDDKDAIFELEEPYICLAKLHELLGD